MQAQTCGDVKPRTFFFLVFFNLILDEKYQGANLSVYELDGDKSWDKCEDCNSEDMQTIADRTSLQSAHVGIVADGEEVRSDRLDRKFESRS